MSDQTPVTPVGVIPTTMTLLLSDDTTVPLTQLFDAEGIPTDCYEDAIGFSACNDEYSIAMLFHHCRLLTVH